MAFESSPHGGCLGYWAENINSLFDIPMALLRGEGECEPSSFPRRIPDDCVEYSIFILDPSMSEFERRTELQKILSTVKAFNRDFLKDYIWQRESFSLNLVPVNSRDQSHKSQNSVSYLRGRTNYGDSIDDEWLIVFMLRELSMKFEKLWARVSDADGEFLLIEAATALPKWLNPEIADYRVISSNCFLGSILPTKHSY